MIEEESVKEDFVGVLKSSQVNMALQVIALSFEGSIRANDLLADVFDMRRKKAAFCDLPVIMARRLTRTLNLSDEDIAYRQHVVARLMTGPLQSTSVNVALRLGKYMKHNVLLWCDSSGQADMASAASAPSESGDGDVLCLEDKGCVPLSR